MDCQEKEDDVVRELDVYLAKNLCDKLHVLQYPVCGNARTYSADQRHVARVKPKHKKLEVEVLLDVSSPNYDQSKGEQIAINVDGSAGTGIAEGSGSTYGSSVMDTQVLSSSCVPQQGKRFAAAFFCNGQVHLTPVADVMQMRPSFKYMDRAENRAIQAAHVKSMAESGNSSQDEAEDAKSVNVRFKGVETEAARTARERSYTSYEKSLFEEKWLAASVHPKDDKFSESERHQLVSSAQFDLFADVNGTPLSMEMCQSSSVYLQAIVPCYASSEVDSDVSPANVLSLTKLQTLSLGEQLKALIKSAKIIYFSHLMTLLPGSPDANSVVRSLQSYAVLVQGCWIVKSEVLYPPKTVSAVSGTPAETVCRARDYILCLFSQSNFLVRGEITRKVKLPSEEVKAIFDDIAVMKTGHGWHLRLPPDYSFKVQYPDVHERQTMLWSARYKQLGDQLHLPNGHERSFRASSAKPDKKSPDKVTSHNRAKRALKSPKRPAKPKKAQANCEEASLSAASQPMLPVNQFMNGVPETITSLPAESEQSFSQVVEEMEHTDQVSESFDVLSNATMDGFHAISAAEAMDVKPVFLAPNPANDCSDLQISPDVQLPFVRPDSVGVATCVPNSSVDFCEEQIALINNFQAMSSVNMASINSTVELVANQVRLQTGQMDVLVEPTKQAEHDFQNNFSFSQNPQ